MSKSASFWIGTALSAAMSIPISAQQPPVTDADLARARALLQQTQQQVPPPTAVPTSAPFVTPGPRVDLSIQDAVARATDKNIDISIARITPQLTDFTIAGLEANYRLNLTSAANNTRRTDLPRLTTQGISNPTTTMTESWSAGLAKNMWKGGGNYQLSWTNGRSDSPALTNIRNPQYTSGITGNLTQPLMRGFRIDATRAAIRTNRITQENDEITAVRAAYPAT